ncbi:AC4 [Hemidesmus yellow mosaic virus]|uniref:AC4 n=1 Tax=Hemidesmus yellow mosaic virus TaxID=1383052 RepID=S5VP26_9GEMI|nr:AC4 [Hemidesmus yellow mosaic virus]AGS77272.1 AC4 [Hemidesmus yellow mosaic virus]AGS77279.1 AC4 [Hemidesmus yellow mosaic virus]
MGNLISMCCCSSRENTTAPPIVSSICLTQAVAPVSTQTFNALSPPPTSRHISERTETPSTGVSFRSTMRSARGGQKSANDAYVSAITQEVSRRLLILLKN